MIVNKNTELGYIAEICYNMLIQYNLQVSTTELVFILEYLFGKKWDYRDPKLWNDARFASYLIDTQINFNEGKDIDLSVLHKDLINVFDFTKKERDILVDGNVEERIWSVLKYVSDKDHQEYVIQIPDNINEELINKEK